MAVKRREFFGAALATALVASQAKAVAPAAKFQSGW